jgi:hypothetical protein
VESRFLTQAALRLVLMLFQFKLMSAQVVTVTKSCVRVGRDPGSAGLANRD